MDHISSFFKNFIHLFETNIAADRNPHITYFFKYSEYLTYASAVVIIFYALVLLMITIFNKNNRNHVLPILKRRLVVCNILALSLTIILAGHIIRFVSKPGFVNMVMLIFLILIRELLLKYVNHETEEISRMIVNDIKLGKSYPIFQ